MYVLDRRLSVFYEVNFCDFWSSQDGSRGEWWAFGGWIWSLLVIRCALCRHKCGLALVHVVKDFWTGWHFCLIFDGLGWSWAPDRPGNYNKEPGRCGKFSEMGNFSYFVHTHFGSNHDHNFTSQKCLELRIDMANITRSLVGARNSRKWGNFSYFVGRTRWVRVAGVFCTKERANFWFLDSVAKICARSGIGLFMKEPSQLLQWVRNLNFSKILDTAQENWPWLYLTSWG